MQYPQFAEKTIAIAADETKHVERLAEKIKLFGGRLAPTCRRSGATKNSWQYLSKI